jgi:uncharacterized protein (DUF58 family)
MAEPAGMPLLHQIRTVVKLEREAWIRFLLALVGLTAAFTAAVFSTVERIAGNLIATAVLASLSLLLAGVVGLLTVPYLARRVAVARVRDAFDYDVTREGMIYLALTLVIGVAALNTGNNLLFIIVSVMLAAVIVSGTASAGVLRALELDISLPTHVFAGTAAVSRVRLHNLRRVMPAFSVSVVAPKLAKAQRRLRYEKTTFVFPPRNPSVHLPDVTFRFAAPKQNPSDPVLRDPVYFPYIPARATVTAEVNLDFPRRGRYAQESFGLATRFPFSFLVKTRRVPVARELIVYPRVDATDEMLDILPMIRGEFESFMRGRGYDLYRIRNHVPEDSARHVDWKATAKTGELKVREFTREDERKIRIIFDNPAPGIVADAEYEQAVATAASLAWHFGEQSSELSFLAPGYSGSSDLHEFLRYLALVQPAPGETILDSLPSTTAYSLIVTARSRGSVPTALWASSYVVFVNVRK